MHGKAMIFEKYNANPILKITQTYFKHNQLDQVGTLSFLKIELDNQNYEI
jgi:hypothetical protein